MTKWSDDSIPAEGGEHPVLTSQEGRPVHLRAGDIANMGFAEAADVPVLLVDEAHAFNKQLAARGWIAPAWPKQYGGLGASIYEQMVFSEATLAMPLIHDSDFPWSRLFEHHGIVTPRCVAVRTRSARSTRSASEGA